MGDNYNIEIIIGVKEERGKKIISKQTQNNSIDCGGLKKMTQGNVRLKALEIWLKSGRKKKPKEIAEELGALGVNAKIVSQWKYMDKWNEIPEGRMDKFFYFRRKRRERLT